LSRASWSPIIETLSDTFLDTDLPFPLDTLLISLVVLATAAILSGLAFRRIDRLTGELRLRNEELQVRNATARGLQEARPQRRRRGAA